MQLQDFFLKLNDDGKALLLGNETDNPLCYGFNSKRTALPPNIRH